MTTRLTAGADIAAARTLIERSGLRFEPGFDELFGVHEGGELVAVGARAGDILKMLTVDAAHRGGGLLGEVVSALVASGLDAGCESLFIYTKPSRARSFEALNFTLLADQGEVTLLEFGGGLKHWLASQRSLQRPGANGAVVMGCDPFTDGHRHLVEAAASAAAHLYIFVGRDDRSPAPLAHRLRLAREATRDIANAVVLDAGPYRIAEATFPTYFLQEDDPVALIRAELEARLFASRIAPFFGIVRRFTGFDAMPADEHAAMLSILAEHGVEVLEIPRLNKAAGVIGAATVDTHRNPPPGDSQ